MTDPARWLDAVGRLVTDEALRARFRADPGALDVDEADRAELAGLVDALEAYARSLLAKRRQEFAGAVPLSARVVPDLPDRYARWLARNPAPVADTPLGPAHAEALRALPVLAAALRADDACAPYAADLLVFEVLRACSRHDGVAREARLAYPVHAWLDDLARGLFPVDPDPAPTRYRFARDLRWMAA